VNNRKAIYSFFQKHLKLPGNEDDKEFEFLKGDELKITPTGQVGTSLKGETISSLNLKYFEKSSAAKNQNEKPATVAGYSSNRKLTSSVFTGKRILDEFEIQKFFLESNLNDYAVPVYRVSNNTDQSMKNLVWLHAEGKEKPLESKAFTETLKSGYVIWTLDLPGIGELKDPGFKGDGFVKNVPFNYTFGANLVGKSIPGIQAEALDLLIQHIRKNEATRQIIAFAENGFTELLLLYSAIENPFQKIFLAGQPETYQSLAETPYYDPAKAYALPPGCLMYFEQKDLINLISEQKVKFISQKEEIIKELN
jgi:hypothetical protein